VEFGLTPEEKQVLETSAQFARRLRERHRVMEEKGVDPETKKLWEELGLEYLDLPEGWGGAGLPVWLKALTLEELAYGCAGATLALHGKGVAGKILSLLKDPPSSVGEWFHSLKGPIAVAVDPEERIRVEDSRVEGELPFVLHREPLGVVVIGKEELYLVQPDHREPVLVGGLDACGGCAIRLEGAPVIRVPVEPRERARMMAYLRILQTALLSGIARSASEYARRYDLDREAFGRKIAHHQAIAFRLAELHITTEAIRGGLLKASFHFEEDLELGVSLAHQAYLFAWETALPLTITAVQLLGGHGFVRDHPVEKWMRDARAVASLFGGPILAEEELVDATLEGLLPSPLSTPS
jgi:alkylation response protein AidB-like acyl-CoA dehydrogenase